jgi:hypothetical protein
MYDPGMKEWLTIRNALGAVLLWSFFRVAGSAMSLGMDGAGRALWAMALLIVAACLFSSTLRELLSRPFIHFIDSVYFGNNDREPPPLSLKLAAVYRGERRFDEAMAEYERQLEYHPHSPELWSEMIRTAQEAGDRDMVQTLQRRAFRKLKAADRGFLETEFSRL